jgi:hypothetical protein
LESLELQAVREDYCPNCGNFVDELDEASGWCFDCSGTGVARCMACGDNFHKDQPHRKLCPKCRDERFLERHADTLEDYLSYGARIGFAKREVYKQNRPVCIACGNPMNLSKAGATFCKRTIECRRWRRRYRTLKEKYHDSKQALSQVSAEVFASRHKMEIKSE